jgi:hypothetical protein
MRFSWRNFRPVTGVFAALVACLLLSGARQGLATTPTNNASPTVGVEGRLQMLLAGTLLDAKPVDPKSRLILRVASTRAHGNLIDYDLRYVGLVPGQYDLRDYLVRTDGTPVTELPQIPVQISVLLPEKHLGELVPQPLRPVPFLGGYKVTLGVVGLVWVAVFILLWTVGRKPRPVAAVPALTAPPTLAERLQPLVQRAALGTLSRDELAQLERLLLSHWRTRLGLQQSGMVEALQQLRAHPEGGALLRQLENWLHRPPGSVKVDVESLLAPYREPVRPVLETAADAPLGGGGR